LGSWKFRTIRTQKYGILSYLEMAMEQMGNKNLWSVISNEQGGELLDTLI